MAVASVRMALGLDAVASGAMGVMLALGAGLAAPVLGLPEGLLRACGVFFLPWAALVGWLAMRPAPGRRAVAWIAALNAVWVVDSVLLLATGWVAPTGLGVAFVLAQAAAVAVFAALQAAALPAAPVAIA